MLRPTAGSKIRWLKMMQLAKNCSKSSECACADNLRRLYLTNPLYPVQKRMLEEKIEQQTIKYKSCYKSNC